MNDELFKSNQKLIDQFGAKKITDLDNVPDFYTFTKELLYTHRDFDKFLKALEKGEKCAIVSGVNASGNLHLGHKIVFDTNLFFQRKYGIPVFIPISDDESYVAGKVEDQETSLKYSLILAKELLAYGFDPKKTFFIIDQKYTDIYNFAIKLSKKINLADVKATYGYQQDDNIGLQFYPAVQAAHILFPQEVLGIKNVLVPIGPDEDAHMRICRDVAAKFGYNKPAAVHSHFLPGLTGEKMSKSQKKYCIGLDDTSKEIEKKIKKHAFSGGKVTLEEHRREGGNPDIDISCIYLSKLFYDKEKAKQLNDKYRNGELLSGEVKQLFIDELQKFTQEFQKNKENISDEQVEYALLKNRKEKEQYKNSLL